MESILVSIISFALIVLSTVTLTMGTLNSAAKLSASWKDMQTKTAALQKTEIRCISPQNSPGAVVELTVENSGQVNLSDYVHWDVIVEDRVNGDRYLTYSANYPPANNQWAIRGIYMSDNVSEVFDVGILDPGEQLLMELNPNPAISNGQPAKIIVATGDGVTTQCFITGATP